METNSPDAALAADTCTTRKGIQTALVEKPLARFSRRAKTTSEIYPELERFVRYDQIPV